MTKQPSRRFRISCVIDGIAPTVDRAHFPRRITEVIARRLAEEPVLVLTGPRTVGKSTHLHEVAVGAGRHVIDLDDLDVRSAVAGDPTLFAFGPAPVLIEEYQKVPELLDAIKAELGRGLTLHPLVMHLNSSPNLACSSWDDGSLLRSYAAVEPFPRIDVPLRGPRPAEIGDRFGEVQAWVAALDVGSRRGARYPLEFTTVGGRPRAPARTRAEVGCRVPIQM